MRTRYENGSLVMTGYGLYFYILSDGECLTFGRDISYKHSHVINFKEPGDTVIQC